ncbi:hypothetical protein GGQ74_001151 [Desulfobaculum xiamenense]|uniref:Uncharacterized protein n=1 Tax=Desulfobaculum xiamenense TaxID=995050 RepID=A0A846QH08_9BACT|nr:hypothetical protein [Desulfobaculum xiamenense]NJB67511.1 hypothetical protein [Desulfobaculum xiamenense]
MVKREDNGELRPAWCAVIWTLLVALIGAAVWIGGIRRDVEANTAFREQAQPRLERMETILERMDGVLRRIEEQWWQRSRDTHRERPDSAGAEALADGRGRE